MTDIRQQKAAAKAAGYQAGRDGSPSTDNPFLLNGPDVLAVSWNTGWTLGYADGLRVTAVNRMLARTDFNVKG